MDASPSPPAPPSSPRKGEAAGTSRYPYLVGRLHNRQITMEEATELFGVMQAMLRDSQAVRARIEGVMATSAKPPSKAPAAAKPAVPSRIPPSDDLLLLGLLALGATAGLGAAFARRLGVAGHVRTPPPARATETDRPA